MIALVTFYHLLIKRQHYWMIQIARGAWYNVLRISLVMRVIHHMSPARLPNARHGFADVTIATPKRPIMTSLSLSEGHLWQ